MDFRADYRRNTWVRLVVAAAARIGETRTHRRDAGTRTNPISMACQQYSKPHCRGRTEGRSF
jgi:hypothetical protein